MAVALTGTGHLLEPTPMAVLGGLVGGLVYGLVTAPVLLWLLRDQPAKEEPPPPTL
jgi:hypothetical protein